MLLSSIVTDICTRAGIDSSSLDVTELTDDVLGYKIPRQMPARTALETLMAAYNFDAVEKDWKLYFKKRGSTSVATIVQSEMRAHNIREQPPDLSIETRTQDLELPTHFTLTYESKDREYEVTSQNAVRVDKANFLQRESQIGIVLDDSYAKQQCEILLKQIWTNRHRYKFATYNKYLKLSPGDVITVNGKLMRIVEMTDAIGKIELLCESESGGVYVSSAQADDLTTPTPDLTASTSIPYFIALDIPAISEDYGNYGLTCAMFLSGGHNGGTIQYSIDGNDYVDGGYFSTVNAVVGNTTAALSTGKSGIIDNSELLTIDLSTSGGSVATIGTSLLHEGANLAAIGTSANGYELLQFQTVTSSTSSTSVYTITGFLRGLYGTDYLRGSHTTSDKFVLLTNTSGEKHGGVDFISTPSTINYLMKSVNYLGGEGTPQIENSGRKTLEPYAPQVAFGSRNSSNDIDLNWYRGDRYEFAEPDLSTVDTVQNEESVNYSVNVIHPVSSAVLRTVNTTESTWTYTAAMQSTDGYPQTHPIIFDIYQISTVIASAFTTNGRGQPLRVSI